MKDELVLDGLSTVQIKPSYDILSKEAQDLDDQIRQIQEALTTLLRVQQRSLETNLFNKANEVQEDISLKRFDLRVAQIHLSAISSQVRTCPLAVTNVETIHRYVLLRKLINLEFTFLIRKFC